MERVTGPFAVENGKVTITAPQLGVLFLNGAPHSVLSAGRHRTLTLNLPWVGKKTYILFDNAEFEYPAGMEIDLRDGTTVGLEMSVWVRPAWDHSEQALLDIAERFGTEANRYARRFEQELRDALQTEVLRVVGNLDHAQFLHVPLESLLNIQRAGGRLAAIQSISNLVRRADPHVLRIREELKNQTFQGVQQAGQFTVQERQQEFDQRQAFAARKHAVEMDLTLAPLERAAIADAERWRSDLDGDIARRRHSLQLQFELAEHAQRLQINAQTHASELTQKVNELRAIAEVHAQTAALYGVSAWDVAYPEYAVKIKSKQLDSLLTLVTEYQDVLPPGVAEMAMATLAGNGVSEARHEPLRERTLSDAASPGLGEDEKHPAVVALAEAARRDAQLLRVGVGLADHPGGPFAAVAYLSLAGTLSAAETSVTQTGHTLGFGDVMCAQVPVTDDPLALAESILKTVLPRLGIAAEPARSEPGPRGIVLRVEYSSTESRFAADVVVAWLLAWAAAIRELAGNHAVEVDFVDV